jgi:hypothetical protein
MAENGALVAYSGAKTGNHAQGEQLRAKLR